MQGPLLVPFISPYSRHGVWDMGSDCYWLLGRQAHLCLSSVSTVHSLALFLLLPWPLGPASPSPRVGKEQASLPSCRTASTGSCSKSLADSATPHSLFFSSNYFCIIFSRIFTQPRLKAKVLGHALWLEVHPGRSLGGLHLFLKPVQSCNYTFLLLAVPPPLGCQH